MHTQDQRETVRTAESADGTRIAYEKAGQGPAVILVGGAFNSRDFGPNAELVPLLAERFTVINYDRRGRGESGDTAPYAVEREIEDLAALIDAAGGSAHVYGISSGAALALEAARAGLPIERLALYEAPFVVDGTRPPVPDYAGEIDRLLAEDRRGEVIKLFMTKGVLVPGFVVTLMRFMPAWKHLKSVAHTLAYDVAILGDTGRGAPLPAGRWASVTVPALVGIGGKSPQWMKNGMAELASVLPDARLETLPGQTHILKGKAMAPVLTEFFGG